MTNKLQYNPSLLAIYLDDTSISFLDKAPFWEFWILMAKKIHSIFPALPIFIRSKYLKIPDEIIKKINLTIDPNSNTELEFLLKVGEALPPSKFQDPDWDEICFLYLTGISPLLDIDLTKEQWDRHKRFFSQYSYSENIPEGLIPKVLTREFLSSIPKTGNIESHSFLLKNINLYDVDIFFKSPDLRQYRLDFRDRSSRDRFLLKNFLLHSEQLIYDQILPTLEIHPEWFRPYPSYLEWEIYQGCEKSCTFCPRQSMDLSKDGTKVTLKEVEEFLEKLEDWHPGTMTVSLGGNGEPFLNPDVFHILERLTKSEIVTELIIETALYTKISEFKEWISAIPEIQKNKICLIVNLSTLIPERYLDLYGTGSLESVLDSAKSLLPILGKEKLLIQMLKIMEVHDEIENFFNSLEKLGFSVILQKYNRFAGRMIEKRVSDLTPIKREFCWHLVRDLYCNADGSVSLCKQTFDQSAGNWKTEELSEIWERGYEAYTKSFVGKHQNTNLPCIACDEWYTFNA